MAIMKYVTIDKKRPNMTIIDINCPPKLIELIQKCWDEEPNKRPVFNQIIEVLAQIDSTVQGQWVGEKKKKLRGKNYLFVWCCVFIFTWFKWLDEL